jgi:hypothetical protein
MATRRTKLSACIGGGALVLLLVGWLLFPDAPINECPSGYCSKFGHPRTPEDYRLFRFWELCMFIYWPIGIVALLVLNWRQFKP